MADRVLGERRTVAGQQSGVSAIEAIARTVAMDIYHNAVDSDDGSHSMDMPVAVELITYAITPLARQAEALQRENAELREVLADSLRAFRCTQNVDRYPADHWCHRARALLGGENAE